MTTTQAPPAALPPSVDVKVKMEDRKRSLAADVDDLGPSQKRLRKDENGQQMRMDAEKEKEVEVSLTTIAHAPHRDADGRSHAELPERCDHASNERVQAAAQRLRRTSQRPAKEVPIPR